MPPATLPAPADSAPDRLLALADRCVQCGLCLPACPTYSLERSEAESPRGRIALARAWTMGSIPATEAADIHLDHCLGCHSCEAVCPAGVQFGELLVEARSRQRLRRGPGPQQRLAEWLAARPALLQRALELYRRIFPLVPARFRRMPRPERHARVTPTQASIPNAETASLFIGCVARSYEAGLRDAVVRLCAATGVDLQLPSQQTCCGALHAHAGQSTEAGHLKNRNRSAFAGSKAVLTLASGCHETLSKSLSGIAPVVDAITFLHQRAASLRFDECNERVVLHLPCTQRNVVKSATALRELLARVPGLEVVELTAGHGCCGAAGTQMLVDPVRANTYRQPLVEEFERSGATRLLSANIGCRLHLANASSRPLQHPLEFLASLTQSAAVN